MGAVVTRRASAPSRAGAINGGVSRKRSRRVAARLKPHAFDRSGDSGKKASADRARPRKPDRQSIVASHFRSAIDRASASSSFGKAHGF